MAKQAPTIQIYQVWEDGTQTSIVITGETTYPDALAEMKATAMSMFSEAIDVMNARVE